MEHTASDQQRRIFQEIGGGSGHIVVNALAGTGKTWTIINGIAYSPARSILLCAFNKKIADHLNGELRQKNGRAQAQTLHSVGYRLVRGAWVGINVERDPDVSRADRLSMQVCGTSVPEYITRLVSKLHTKGREIAPHARKVGDLEHLVFQFDCEPDETWVRAGYDAYYVESKALEAMDLAARVRPEAIDFSDMIYLPVRNKWMVPMYDEVYVDEAQDMTIAQLEIAMGVLRPKGRMVIVGDRNQAIYKFRGADSESMDRLKLQLNAKELPLTVTYRCGKAIVEEAQRFVPTFEAHENNADGIITDAGFEEMLKRAEPGDFILSRVNAPLVETALALLKQGKRARITGRDIGAGLQTLIRKVGHGTQDINMFLTFLDTWRKREVMKWEAANKPSRAEQVNDKASMLVELCEDAKSVDEVARKIDALFVDQNASNSITCSSVHRAKGLEANRVFVLAETLKDRNQEERNIQYVAITRAKKELVWVYSVGIPEQEEEKEES